MFLISLPHSHQSELRAVRERLDRAGCRYQSIALADRVQVVAFPSSGHEADLAAELQRVRGVERVVRLRSPYCLSAREATEARTRVTVSAGLEIGGNEFVVMAGPCAIESYGQTRQIAGVVKGAGARVLRGGAFKPRTSPFAFQGLGHDGLEVLRGVREETGLPIISELMDQSEAAAVDEAVDIIQIGMRNALNYALLRDVGRLRSRRPVLLKCGIGTTLDEFLCAADYILCEGNPNVILCLRGTIGISRESRSSLNVADIPALRKRTHLPIIVDPSHVAGAWDLVPAIAASAVVAGADGLLVEVHHDPSGALCDAGQCLRPELFHAMMHRIRLLAQVMGRTMASAPEPMSRGEAHPFSDFCLEAPPAAPAKEGYSRVGLQAREAAL